MADVLFNVAAGRLGYYQTLPAADDALLIVLLKQAGLQADDALRDNASLAAVLAGGSSEATFTAYARKVVTVSVTISVDNTTNQALLDFPDVVWSPAGGASNDTLGKLLICYRPATTSADSAVIPLTGHDFVVTTDGSDLTAQLPAGGYCRVQQGAA